MHEGRLSVRVINAKNSKPICNAKVIIKNHEAEGKIKFYNPKSREYSAVTNNLGYTKIFELEIAADEFQKSVGKSRPFIVSDVWVKAYGFKDCVVRGVEVFPGVMSIETCKLNPLSTKESNIDVINVLPSAVFERYPPKIPELAEKINDEEFKKIYISSMAVIPSSLVVHNGLPEDNTALDYTIELKEYIKNVACSTMDPTWSENSLRAGVLSIMSFTLNRIYTQHYRKKGRNYDITSSTAYDQLFSYGRNVYINISEIVNELYPRYIVKSGNIAPLLIECCDGIRNRYPGWFSYSESNVLGQQEMCAKNILKALLGEDIEIINFSEIKAKVESRYRSFVPPMPPNTSKGTRPKVSYPDDV